MKRLGLSQTITQKLSPQQIQFIKLLQVPTAELDTRIEEELEINPALEEGKEEDITEIDSTEDQDFEEEKLQDISDEINVEDYIREEDYTGYKMQGDGVTEEDKDFPIPTLSSLNESLLTQLGFLGLNKYELAIAEQLIGSIENDGYIRRDMEAIVNDLAFSQNIETNFEDVEAILLKIQEFDPPGIAARNLKECLLLQLERKKDQSAEFDLAIKILNECFDEFTKKHYNKIIKKLDIGSELVLKDAVDIIIKLNPKPGDASVTSSKSQFIIPDFILSNLDGKLELTLNSKNAPELRISRSYSDMFKAYAKSDKKDKKLRETVSFVKQKLDSAKWFIDAIRQRQQTLLRTMNAIVHFQYDYFFTGDESKLKPMILKDIAEKINMDISTISRVANSKAIQTEFGLFSLKYFFSEGIATDSGEDVSSREVKNTLKKLIDKEDKTRPLSDDKLEKHLKAHGYNIARRTVAKYREQMNIPVARLRKEL